MIEIALCIAIFIHCFLDFSMSPCFKKALNITFIIT